MLGNLGTIAAGQGELAAALGWVDEAVELTRRIDDTEALGTNLAVHAEIDAILGRTDEVRRHGAEALALARRVRLHSLAANALTMLGVAELLDGRAAARPCGWSTRASRRRSTPRRSGSGRSPWSSAVTCCSPWAVPDEAVTAYEEAEQAFGRLEVRGSALEARAKRARALLAGGDVAGAHEVAAALVVAPRGAGDRGRPGRRRRGRVLGGAGRRRRPGRPRRARTPRCSGCDDGRRPSATTTWRPSTSRGPRRGCCSASRAARVSEVEEVATPHGPARLHHHRVPRTPGRRWCSATPRAAGCTTRRCWPPCAAPRRPGSRARWWSSRTGWPDGGCPPRRGRSTPRCSPSLAHLRAASELPLVTGGRSFGGRVACRTSRDRRTSAACCAWRSRCCRRAPRRRRPGCPSSTPCGCRCWWCRATATRSAARPARRDGPWWCWRPTTRCAPRCPQVQDAVRAWLGVLLSDGGGTVGG